MADSWYYKLAGQEYGPVPFDTLYHLAQAAAIGAEDEVKAGAESEWTVADSIVGLISSGQAGETDAEGAARDSGSAAASPSPAVAPSAGGEAMFYWRTFGQEFGPVPGDVFKEMIEREELSRGDFVRMEAGDGWLPFEVLQELSGAFAPSGAAAAAPAVSADEFELQPGFDRPEPSDPFAELAANAELESVNAEDILNEVLSSPALPMAAPAPPIPPGEPSVAPEISPTPAQPTPFPPAAASASPVPMASYTPPPTPVATAPKAAPPPPPKPKRSGPPIDWGSLFSGFMNPKVLIGLAAGLVVVGLFFIPWGGGADEKYYQDLVKLQGDFRELRRKNAPPGEWKALEDRAGDVENSMLPDLKKRAGAKTPISQNLLFAARDYLPGMLQSAREGPTEDERMFNKHLEIAGALLSGKPMPVETDDEIVEGEAPAGGGE